MPADRRRAAPVPARPASSPSPAGPSVPGRRSAGWVPARTPPGPELPLPPTRPPRRWPGAPSPDEPEPEQLDDAAAGPPGRLGELAERARDRLPAPLAAARWGLPGGAAVVALLVAVLVAGTVLAVAALLRPNAPQVVPARPAPEPAATAATAATEPSGQAGAPVPPAPSAAGEVVVHVVGAVNRPGLVRLPAGARVADAVEAAGGAAGDADLTRVNLARPVVDGEQVHVPRPGELLAPVPGPGPTAASGGSGPAPSGAPLDLNTATLDQLDALPGIGPVLAQRILDWRAEHGRFSTVEELAEVSGIGDSVLEQVRPLVRV